MSEVIRKSKIQFAILLSIAALTFSASLAHAADASARFRAAEVLLSHITRELVGFDYPNVHTADFPELVSPYAKMLEEWRQSLENGGILSSDQQTQLSLFCSIGMTNLKQLIGREPRSLLIPSQPGETLDGLRKKHSQAIAFFHQQELLSEVIVELLDCSK